MTKSIIEKLTDTHPDLEVWWDSSPLMFERWVQKLLTSSENSRKDILEAQLRRLYNADDPASSLFRGCTTNPPLSWDVVKSDPHYWGEYVDDLVLSHPDLNYQEISWLTYKEIVKRGAEMYMPIYQASNARFGWISGQLNPRLFTEIDQMVNDAKELSAISPNVMIKVPASMQGVEVVKQLTSLGISTNTTTCFTLPQIMAVANAAMEGIQIANKTGVKLDHWRAVITMMIGRLTERPVLDLQAERRNIKLSWQDKHWFGIAVFRRAYKLLTEGGYASKLLACSMRDGPIVAGKPRFWDVEKIAGGAIVYTCPPYVLEPLFEIGDDLELRAEIKEDVPQSVLDKMSHIPYCIQAYDPNGLELEQFNDHPATIDTVEAFSKAFKGMEDFVKDRITTIKGQPELAKS
jgi:transaldolase